MMLKATEVLRRQHRLRSAAAALATVAGSCYLYDTNCRRKDEEGDDGGDTLPSRKPSNASQHILLRQALAGPLAPTTAAITTQCSIGGFLSGTNGGRSIFSSGAKSTPKRQSTLEKMHETATRSHVDDLYAVSWEKPIGIGMFGSVYKARHRETGELVAVKQISKQFTNDSTFQREMDLLLYLEETGGHPSICHLREHFVDNDDFYLVLDLVEGGELFEHLCWFGAYSEADAARVIRQTASALAFLHGACATVESNSNPNFLAALC